MSVNWMVVNWIRGVPLACVLLAAGAAHGQQGGDFLLVNGRILTVDARDSVAQAVAITDGKIVAAGSNDAARKAAAKGARVIDLMGRAVTPGLIDSHCHFQEVDALYSVDLSDASVSNIADVLKKVQRGVE